MLGRRVVIVEDNAEDAEALRDYLEEKMGITVIIIPAFNDEMIDQAYQRILDIHPGVALIDLKLGSASGYRLIELLRSNKRTRSIWRIVVSGNIFVTKRREARKFGADDAVGKPYDLEDVREAIEKGVDRVHDFVENDELLDPVYQEFVGSDRALACVSSDWNGYGERGMLLVVGEDRGRAHLEELNAILEDRILSQVDSRFRYFARVRRTDGALMIVPAEQVQDVLRVWVEAFYQARPKVYTKEDLDRGYSIRDVTEYNDDGQAVTTKGKHIPLVDLSIGVNPNRAFEGKLSFAYDDPEAWQAKPLLYVPRPMYLPRIVQRRAEVARIQAEKLSKMAHKTWIAIDNQRTWDELHPEEQDLMRQRQQEDKIKTRQAAQQLAPAGGEGNS